MGNVLARKKPLGRKAWPEAQSKAHGGSDDDETKILHFRVTPPIWQQCQGQ